VKTRSLFAFGLVAACSAQVVTAPANGPAPDDAGAAEAAPGTDAAGADAAHDPGTDAASPRVDAPSGADTAAPDTRIDPLEIGRTWTYDVKTMGSFPVCTAGTHDSTITGTTQVDGRTAFTVTSFCGAVGTSNITVDGDAVDYDYNGTWLHVTGLPIQDGVTWSYFNTSYTWQKVPSITVPAGTFADCWKANQNVSYTAYQIYCRGVGVVQSYSQDLGGNGWDAQLSAKTF
jgi:hypothetical protein